MEHMRKILLGVLLLSLPAAVHADERDLRVLAGTLHDELQAAELDPETRAEVTALLARSLELVRRSGGQRVRSSACVDFATSVYERTYDATPALEYGMKFCSKPIDVAVLSIAYAAYSTLYDPVPALTEAGTFARREDLAGKGDLLTVALTAYRRIYDPVPALKSAAELVATESRSSLGCVERAYATYSRQWDAVPALRKSFEVCD